MAVPELGNDILWFAPEQRAIIALDEFHASHSLRRVVQQGRFRVVSDQDFRGVMEACARPRPGHEETWISDSIIDVYTALHEKGWAHSIECYQDERLVGGLYGVSLGGAFFGESMFHVSRDASKVALWHLVAHLHDRRFVLLDVQYLTPHLATFGAREIPKSDYEELLAQAVSLDVSWSWDRN